MYLNKTIAAALALMLGGIAGAQTQAEMNEQAVRDFNRADAALNAQYKVTQAFMVNLYTQSKASLPPAERKGLSSEAMLLASERAWLRFRDAQCELENYQSIGGTIHGFGVTMCMTDLTLKRTKQLKDLQTTNPNYR